MHDRLAIISLHDVTPARELEVRQAVSVLRGWGFARFALLVVPDFRGRWALTNHPGFCEWVRDLVDRGCELVLHGWTHEMPRGTRGGRIVDGVLGGACAEFRYLGFSRAAERMRLGREMVERAIGREPVGFVPPGWLAHRDTYRAADVEGLGFVEDHVGITDLSTLRRHVAPAVAFRSGNLVRTAASVAWAGMLENVAGAWGDVRVAIHPGDLASEILGEAAGRLVARVGARCRWVGYGAYLDARRGDGP